MIVALPLPVSNEHVVWGRAFCHHTWNFACSEHILSDGPPDRNFVTSVFAGHAVGGVTEQKTLSPQ